MDVMFLFRMIIHDLPHDLPSFIMTFHVWTVYTIHV